MFHSARLQLTAWYLCIIFLVTSVFSFAFYHLATEEINRISRRLQMRQQITSELFFEQFPQRIPNILVLEEAKERLRITLIGINASILIVAGCAGYFLAGRTLKPIQRMVDEQNRFIADASHELRTPLTALRSEMEAALLEKNISSQNAKQLISSNLEEVARLQTLMDYLLELVPSKKQHITYKSISLLQTIEDALKIITKLAKLKHIAINNIVDDIQIHADALQLAQLWVILLENAIKYSPDKSKITISTKTFNNSITVSVADQGIGINRTEYDKIFDRFYRADKSRSKDNTVGYGLGLSIAKEIVSSLNGTIMVKSVVGKGSVFKVTLPISGRIYS